MDQQAMLYEWITDVLDCEDIEVTGSDVASQLVADLLASE